MRLHALVDNLETARIAVEGGATVIQLRVKGISTDELVEIGRPFRALPVTSVVNDDVEATLRLEADGVHLGRSDPGAERALAPRPHRQTSSTTATTSTCQMEWEVKDDA